MTFRLALDRFEGRDKSIAVLIAEDGQLIHPPRDLRPDGSSWGEVLILAVEPVRSRTSDARAPVDINDTSAADLQSLPGVGSVFGERGPALPGPRRPGPD